VKKILLLVVGLGLPGRLAAQSGATVSADAVVVTVGMTIGTLRDLNFGTVIKGVATTVLPTAATAGEWQVTGSSTADQHPGAAGLDDADFLQRDCGTLEPR